VERAMDARGLGIGDIISPADVKGNGHHIRDAAGDGFGGFAEAFRYPYVMTDIICVIREIQFALKISVQIDIAGQAVDDRGEGEAPFGVNADISSASSAPPPQSGTSRGRQ